MTHVQAVYNALKDGKPHTLYEIREIAELELNDWRPLTKEGEEWDFLISECGASARIRDLRKKGHEIEVKPSKPGSHTFLYRLIPPNEITRADVEALYRD